MRVVAALLALVVVAGCGGDPQPREPKPSTSVSASTTPTPPVMPAQAKSDSPEGAAAFVKHYIDVFNYASNTGDVTELSRLSSPKCDGCQRYIKLYRDTYAAGGYFKNSDWNLNDIRVNLNAEHAIVFARATSQPGTYAENAKASPAPGNAEDSKLTFISLRERGEWILDALELQADS